MSILQPRNGMLAAIQKLGFNAGLQIVYDIGDEASYPGTGQNVVNIGPTANCDIWRGTSASAEGTDPAFNGVAGRRSDGEYFSFDGGDKMYSQGAMPTNIYNTHRNNALFTIAGWFYRATTDIGRIFGSSAGNAANVGHQWLFLNSSQSMQFTVHNGGGTAFDSTMAVTWPQNSWAFLAISIDEANNTGFHRVNQQTLTFACTYTSPNAGGSTSGMIAAGDAQNTGWAPNGTRYASIAMWEGRRLTAPEIEALWQATRGKYNL